MDAPGIAVEGLPANAAAERNRRPDGSYDRHSIWGGLGHLGRDLRYSVRGLARESRFTALAMLTLAFGIGANTVIFSVLDDLIVGPSARNGGAPLVAVHLVNKGGDRNFRRFSQAEFKLLQDSSDVFAGVAALNFSYVVTGRNDEARQSLFCTVSGDYFSMLGVQPWRGRFFTRGETQNDANIPVLVASYSLWQRMGAQPNFVGSHLLLNGRDFEVIGIAPRGFGGIQWAIGPEAWLPMGVRRWLGGEGASQAGSDAKSLNVVASLRPGLTIERTQAAASLLTARLNEAAGELTDRQWEVLLAAPSRSNLDLTAPADEGSFSTYAAIAVGLSAAVLLVASLNVANMLLARGTARRKEIAIRLAVGAPRSRIVAQLLTEGAVLALGGGMIALVVTRLGRGFLLGIMRDATAGQKYVVYHEASMHLSLLVGGFAVCLAATLLCSLGPALRATRLNLVEDLKQQAGDPAEVGLWNRFFSPRHCVVMVQIALSLVLLVSAGLLARCAMQIENARGFSRDGLVANFNFGLGRTTPAEIASAHRALLTTARRVAGVEGVALASSIPYNFETNLARIYPARPGDGAGAGADPSVENARVAVYTSVSAGYFDVLGIPLVRGRDFMERETVQSDGPQVAIIDEQLARALFGKNDPIGRRLVNNKAFADGRHPEQEIEVVGTVRSPREDPMSRELPMRIYRPVGQAPSPMTYIHVKTSRPAVVLPALRRELTAVDPTRPLLFCGPLAAIVDNNLNLWSIRLSAILFAVFGVVALFLTIIGVYAVKAYAVARRTREFGIRMALGADARSIVVLVLKQGLLQSAVGLGVGLVLAVLAGVSLSKLLFGVAPIDFVVLVSSILVLLFAVLGACLVPARRAAGVKPFVALRAE